MSKMSDGEVKSDFISNAFKVARYLVEHNLKSVNLTEAILLVDSLPENNDYKLVSHTFSIDNSIHSITFEPQNSHLTNGYNCVRFDYTNELISLVDTNKRVLHIVGQ